MNTNSNVSATSAPSKYQTAVYQWVKEGQGSAVIEAIAGSGKTTVLKKVTELVPSDKTGILVAFNKSIVEELKSKITNKNFEIMTSHSLGYQMLKGYFKNLRYPFQRGNLNLKRAPGLCGGANAINNFKYSNFIKNNFNVLCQNIDFTNEGEKSDYEKMLINLTDISRCYLSSKIEDFEFVIDKYENISKLDADSAIKQLPHILQNIVKWGFFSLDEIDFTDMISLPNYLNLDINLFKKDWILVDEAQDLNVAQQQLVRRCNRTNGSRFIYVGDGMQCIQTFAGSDNECFQKLKKMENTITLPLSINYRCPAFVEKLAQQYVPEFEVFNKQKEGIYKHGAKVDEIKNESMVICRKVSPLITLYHRLIKQNKQCYIKGVDVGKTLADTIKRVDKEYISSDLNYDGLIPQLYKEAFEYRNALMKKAKLSLKDASQVSTFTRKIEVIETLEALSEGINSSTELLKRCETIFKNDSNGICLITNHKAKGLENDVVYHLCPSIDVLAAKSDPKDWEIQTEDNLKYVLYTRTKNEFYTVCENDFPAPKGASSTIDDLICELEHKETAINKLFQSDVNDKLSLLIVGKNIEDAKKILQMFNYDYAIRIFNSKNNFPTNKSIITVKTRKVKSDFVINEIVSVK